MMKEKPRYTVNEVAELLGYTVSSIRKKIKQGKIRVIREGRSIFVHRDDIKNIPPRGEKLLPERYSDCLLYEECLNMYSRTNAVFGCSACGRYKK